jgi:hypothetical protein
MNSDNKNIKKSAVEKRRETILRKRQRKAQHKEAYHAKREDKYILQAGESYATEKSNVSDYFKLPSVIERERERKKYEKRVYTDAINGMFQIRTIEDDNLNIIQKK